MMSANWERYPLSSQQPTVKVWLTIQQNLGLAPNTIYAYAHALEDFFQFCTREGISPVSATNAHIAVYVHDMTTRPNPHSNGEKIGLSNSTLQQRLTALRLFFDYLVEDGYRAQNPVKRGHYTSGKGYGGQRERGLIPHYHKLPWIPNEEQWQAILAAVRNEPLRNRAMFALAYDAALRREELCSLQSNDIDPAHRLLTIRAENTKNRQGRVVPYSETTSRLYADYLHERRYLSRERGLLFLSTSPRNYAQPISIWTWTKVIEGIAQRSGVKQFTTHTLRHLCLTDLARANWDVHEIAKFAGHRTIQSTLAYIHLSAREIAVKFAASIESLHARQLEGLAEARQ